MKNDEAYEIESEDESSELEKKIDLGNTLREPLYNGNSYKITTTANDFNVSTIYSYFKAGTFEIPPFQRNYVWDIKKASKLIESLILGLPIPQVFLYQIARNRLSIIDGQQRLTSIYFFLSGRFPRPNKLGELRKIMRGVAKFDESILADDKYFTDFKLTFPRGYESILKGKKYGTLDAETQGSLDLTPLRSITVRQDDPQNNQSMYEIFNRLNTGGINLKPQEIRMSLNHSDFFGMLWDLNEEEDWRAIIKTVDFDKHARDVELLTRVFAMLLYSANYSSNSMIQFLNNFSEFIKKEEQKYSDMSLIESYNGYLKTLFLTFLKKCKQIGFETFWEKEKFIFPLFEVCFHAACLSAAKRRDLIIEDFSSAQVLQLLNHPKFIESRDESTNNTKNIETRLRLATEIIVGK